MIRTLASLALYFGALFTVSAISPARIYQLGEPQCSDDWCLAIERVNLQGDLLQVHFNVMSHARRATQREFGISVSLLDAQGRSYPSIGQSGMPFETAIAAGERFPTSRTFRVAPEASGFSVVIHHEGPGALIIADGGSLFHRPTRMLLPGPEKVAPTPWPTGCARRFYRKRFSSIAQSA